MLNLQFSIVSYFNHHNFLLAYGCLYRLNLNFNSMNRKYEIYFDVLHSPMEFVRMQI